MDYATLNAHSGTVAPPHGLPTGSVFFHTVLVCGCCARAPHPTLRTRTFTYTSRLGLRFANTTASPYTPVPHAPAGLRRVADTHHVISLRFGYTLDVGLRFGCTDMHWFRLSTRTLFAHFLDISHVCPHPRTRGHTTRFCAFTLAFTVCTLRTRGTHRLHNATRTPPRISHWFCPFICPTWVCTTPGSCLLRTHILRFSLPHVHHHFGWFYATACTRPVYFSVHACVSAPLHRFTRTTRLYTHTVSFTT